MNFAPQKFFIGLMDFFSIRLPGALLTWLLMGDVGPAVLGDRYAQLAGAQAWAAFLFASYLFGHLVCLLGSSLDEFYDWARCCTLNTQITRLTRRGHLLPWAPVPWSGWCSSASATSPWQSQSTGVRRASQADVRSCLEPAPLSHRGITDSQKER